MAKGELLLEVRVEEIPARMLPGAIHDLGTRLFEELVTRGLTPSAVDGAFTPRRLVVILRGLPEREKDRVEELVGPPVAAAFDADGGARPALAAFAERCGVAPAELQLAEAKKGKVTRRVRRLGDGAPDPEREKGFYLAGERKIVGRSTIDVLAELLPRLLGGLSWAKSMKWGEGVGPWVRPVHGVVGLFDGRVVAFELFGVSSGDETIGHPILSPEGFSVKGVDDYLAALARRQIVVSSPERKRLLKEGMLERSAALGGALVEDDALLEKLAAICEIPGVMEGSFAEELTALPREVLTTSLRDHQSALTVEQDGKLLPAFLTVMDRPDDPAGRVRAGNEWVVAARLADAKFFWEKDRQEPLASRLPALAGLGFQEKLGSYAGKRERLLELTSQLASWMGLGGEEAEGLARAASLLKVDLTTDMVREFTSLQGVMGGIYAREDGEPEAVWQAIYDQYLPTGADDALPRGTVGRLVALADRADTLAGFFGLGMIPTGSRDPFGLRRAALGVVRLALEAPLALDLERVMRAAYGGFRGIHLPKSEEETWQALAAFLEDRVRFVLGQRGFAYDEIDAGLGARTARFADLAGLAARVAAVQAVRADRAFLAVALAAKRIANITKGLPRYEPTGQRLEEAAESALFEAGSRFHSEARDAVQGGDFERGLKSVGALAAPLEKFFLDVMVMHEDAAIRESRIALLQGIQEDILQLADLSAVVVEKAEYR